MKPLRLLLAAAGAALALAAHAQSVEPPARPLRFAVDWLFSGAQAPYLLAADGGHFRRHGLQVQVERGQGAADTVRRVAAGEVDFGVADLGAIVEHNARDPARAVTAIYLVHERSALAVISLDERNIRTPADLEGKLLGAPESDAGRRMFPLFAAAAGIDVARVRWRTVEPALRETALIAGDVDAITGYSLTAPFLEVQGVARDRVRILRYTDWGLQLYGAAVFARADTLKRSPATAAAVAAAVNEAWLAAMAHPQAAIDALQRRGGNVRAGTELYRLRLTIDEVVATPAARRDGLSVLDAPRLSRNIGLIVRGLGLPAVPDPGTVFTAAYLPPLAQRQIPKNLAVLQKR